MHTINNSFLFFVSFFRFFALVRWGFFLLIFYYRSLMCWCSFIPFLVAVTCVCVCFFFIEYSFGSESFVLSSIFACVTIFRLLWFLWQHIALLMQVQTIEQFSTFQAYTWSAFFLCFFYMHAHFSVFLVSYHIVDRCRCTLHH